MIKVENLSIPDYFSFTVLLDVKPFQPGNCYQFGNNLFLCIEIKPNDYAWFRKYHQNAL